MTLPKKIDPCPIIDALVEIRFETNIFKSAVFGFVYKQIQAYYPGEVTQLPILQLPEQLREQDPSLKFKPLYRIENPDFIIQIGPDVLCISSKIPYNGWDLFLEHVFFIISQLTDQKIVKRVIRLGHRYINFFEGNIWDCLSLTTPKIASYVSNNTLIRSELIDGNFINIVQIADSAKYKATDSSTERSGSIIDIDTFREYDDNYFTQNIKSELNQAHLCEKKLFFSLLNPQYLNTLNPEYDN